MAQKKTARPLSGYNLYQDDRGRNILYIKRKELGYLIQEKDESKYFFYKNRFMYVFVAIILGLNFSIPPLVCVGVGIVALGLMEYQYRFKFLPTLTQITNFKPDKKRTFISSIQESHDKGRILLLAVLYILLAILLFLNARELNLSTPIFIANCILSLGSATLGTIHLIAFATLKKK
ncbi:MAG: hypothetical protein ACK5LZ_05045 [Anaerorhabdus sp.]